MNVWCDGDGVAPAFSTVDVGATASVTVRVVKLRPDGVDAGAQFEATPEGARIVSVARLAARSGLKPGDVVTAVDGVSLKGLNEPSMAALAFFFPRDAKPVWTVTRAGQSLTITAAP